MGLMVSPEALRLQGNFAGLNGLFFVLPLAAAVGLHGLHAHAVTAGGPADEIELLTDSFGAFAGALLLLMARPAVALCLATATLVTSGFIFNETFVYWFPNFAFAAILLVFVTAINLAGPRVAAIAQLVFLLTALGGLLGLCAIGWWVPATAPVTMLEPGLTTGLTIDRDGLLLALPAFIGYELLLYTGASSEPRDMSRSMTLGLLIAGCVFLLWNSITLMVVPAERLAQSDIPHIVSARAMAGQTGRLIMGIVGIAGSCAAVLLLFQAVARMGAQMARRGLLPPLLGRNESRPWIGLVGLAAATGISMAMGFAGSAYLDIALRAGLLLWLLFYGSLHLARGLQRRKAGASSLFAMMMCAVLLGAVALLAAQDPERDVLLKVMVVMVILATAFAGLGLAAAAPTGSNHP
jgi:amino acid transporter